MNETETNGKSNIWDPLLKQLDWIPAGLRETFAPARHWIREWSEVGVELSGVVRIHCGGEVFTPLTGTTFVIKFQNRAGLAELVPELEDGSNGERLHLEVVTNKFPDPRSHLAVLEGMLDDLTERDPELLFATTGETSRPTKTEHLPPSPLFIFYFLKHRGAELAGALETVARRPHRELTGESERVDIAEADRLGARQTRDILRNPDELHETDASLAVADALNGRAPEKVVQSRPVDTLDTPPNRFAGHFLDLLNRALHALKHSTLWRELSLYDRDLINRLEGRFTGLARRSPFLETGPMDRLPLDSQVLERRPGYRRLRSLWFQFHNARSPVFTEVDRAVRLRDIPTLYEYWVFFRLAERIGEVVQNAPEYRLASSATGALSNSQAVFPGAGELHFQHSFNSESYSVPLRPDYAWFSDGECRFVLDAKFRLERSHLDGEEMERVERSDLYKMHTYRDALGVEAALAVYPGEESLFYQQECSTDVDASPEDILRAVLHGSLSGIGTIYMQPGEEG